MSARERLPNRRPSQSFTFELHGLRFTATVSRFADGRIGDNRKCRPGVIRGPAADEVAPCPSAPLVG